MTSRFPRLERVVVELLHHPLTLTILAWLLIALSCLKTWAALIAFRVL